MNRQDLMDTLTLILEQWAIIIKMPLTQKKNEQLQKLERWIDFIQCQINSKKVG